MLEHDLTWIWFTGEREQNISGAFALAMSDWAERTHTEQNIELSVTPRRSHALVQMVSSVCGGNQVRSTKISLSCLQSSMVVGVSWSGATWVLPAQGSYSSLREPWMPTCTVTYWSRAWSPPFGDWAAGQYYNMITTTALLKKMRVKAMDWPSMSPDLNPIEHLWGILKRKVEERKVSNIHQLSDVLMEEWKRTPVSTCEALVMELVRGQQIYTVIQAYFTL